MARLKLRDGAIDRIAASCTRAVKEHGEAHGAPIAAAGFAREIVDVVSDELAIHLDLIEDLSNRITALELICAGLRLEIQNRGNNP